MKLALFLLVCFFQFFTIALGIPQVKEEAWNPKYKIMKQDQQFSSTFAQTLWTLNMLRENLIEILENNLGTRDTEVNYDIHLLLDALEHRRIDLYPLLNDIPFYINKTNQQQLQLALLKLSQNSKHCLITPVLNNLINEKITTDLSLLENINEKELETVEDNISTIYMIKNYWKITKNTQISQKILGLILLNVPADVNVKEEQIYIGYFLYNQGLDSNRWLNTVTNLKKKNIETDIKEILTNAAYSFRNNDLTQEADDEIQELKNMFIKLGKYFQINFERRRSVLRKGFKKNVINRKKRQVNNNKTGFLQKMTKRLLKGDIMNDIDISNPKGTMDKITSKGLKVIKRVVNKVLKSQSLKEPSFNLEHLFKREVSPKESEVLKQKEKETKYESSKDFKFPLKAHEDTRHTSIFSGLMRLKPIPSNLSSTPESHRDEEAPQKSKDDSKTPRREDNSNISVSSEKDEPFKSSGASPRNENSPQKSKDDSKTPRRESSDNVFVSSEDDKQSKNPGVSFRNEEVPKNDSKSPRMEDNSNISASTANDKPSKNPQTSLKKEEPAQKSKDDSKTPRREDNSNVFVSSEEDEPLKNPGASLRNEEPQKPKDDSKTPRQESSSNVFVSSEDDKQSKNPGISLRNEEIPQKSKDDSKTPRREDSSNVFVSPEEDEPLKKPGASLRNEEPPQKPKDDSKTPRRESNSNVFVSSEDYQQSKNSQTSLRNEEAPQKPKQETKMPKRESNAFESLEEEKPSKNSLASLRAEKPPQIPKDINKTPRKENFGVPTVPSKKKNSENLKKNNLSDYESALTGEKLRAMFSDAVSTVRQEAEKQLHPLTGNRSMARGEAMSAIVEDMAPKFMDNAISNFYRLHKLFRQVVSVRQDPDNVSLNLNVDKLSKRLNKIITTLRNEDSAAKDNRFDLKKVIPFRRSSNEEGGDSLNQLAQRYISPRAMADLLENAEQYLQYRRLKMAMDQAMGGNDLDSSEETEEDDNPDKDESDYDSQESEELLSRSANKEKKKEKLKKKDENVKS